MKSPYETSSEKDTETEPPPSEISNLFELKQLVSDNNLSKTIHLSLSPKSPPSRFQLTYTLDIDACKNLWQKCTSSETLFDTWEFRYAFWIGYNHVPYFLSLKRNEKLIGLLPLWYDSDDKLFKWFGSDWQEENKFFISNPSYIPFLLELAPPNLYLNSLEGSQEALVKNYHYFTLAEPKYTFDISEIDSVDTFLSCLNKKKRYNFHRDQKHIESLHPQVIINQFDHLPELIRLNRTRFEQKGISSGWEDNRKVKTFTEIINQGLQTEMYEPRMISVLVDNHIAAVDLIVLYNDTYYCLKSGNDIENFPGIGNYLNLLEINDAINLGKKKMDFLEGNFGWKDSFCNAIPLYQYQK